MKEIIVRAFNNEKFNTTFGKGLFRRAVFNVTVELPNPYKKYVVDLFSYAEWDRLASTPDQLEVSKRIAKSDIPQQEDVLLSWIKHYDPITKSKTHVSGFCVVSLETNELYLCIHDEEHGVYDEWTLPVRHCHKSGGNKPVFIATNIDTALNAA